MFNLARIKARFKAEVREAKRFFKRQEVREEFVTSTHSERISAPKPHRHARAGRPGKIVQRARVGFGQFTRMPSVLGRRILMQDVLDTKRKYA